MTSRRATVALVLLVLCVACLAPLTASGQAAPPGDLSLELLDAAGQPETRAGAHPDRFIDRFVVDPAGPPEDAKEMTIDLPKGMGGDLGAVPVCPGRIFGETPYGPGCPAESRIGTLYLGSGESETQLALYSVEPGPNELAVVGADFFVPFRFVVEMRPGDRGLTMRATNLAQPPADFGKESRIELWGVPADHQTGTSTPRLPLLTTPTRCDGGPIGLTLGFRTWQRPDLLVQVKGDTGRPLSGCEQLPFAPGVALALANPSADSSSGARIDLTVPRNDDPDGRVSSQVRSASFALPEGMTISPGGAAGLALCGDRQFGFDGADEPACPPASRVGSVEMAAPQFEQPLAGPLYLGEERPGERFRLFASLRGRGVQMKLSGTMRPDPATGRISATLSDLPEAAFDRMTLRFDGGRGALLATPVGCGPARTVATLTPSSGTAPVTATIDTAIAAPGGSPCAGPPPFAPRFDAAGSSARAGRPTSFRTLLRRRDGEALPDRLEIAFPPGMSAALKGVRRCAGAGLLAGDCPAQSLLGQARAALGPGAEPTRLDGAIYLTGPYRRAPFGMALSFDARIGPFDLGRIVVRAALRIDPHSGRLTVATDSLPRAFEGISVRFREIGLTIDRPGFLRNPTACAPAGVAGTVSTVGAPSAGVSSPFAARGCVGLPFRPAFAMALRGADELHAGGKPALRIATRMRARDAGLNALDVALPKLLRLDPSHLGELCARAAAAAGACPRGSRVGSASARTPLLEQPLRGSIHVAQPRGTGPPDLWVHLEGAGISLDIESGTEARGGRFHTVLADLPDMPLSKFALRFSGGRRGVFALTGGACGRQRRGEVRSEGQNRARARAVVPLATPECK